MTAAMNRFGGKIELIEKRDDWRKPLLATEGDIPVADSIITFERINIYATEGDEMLFQKENTFGFRKGHIPWNKGYIGKKATTETKRKMSLTRTGKKFSNETRKKLSVSLKGNTNSKGVRHKSSIYPERFRRLLYSFSPERWIRVQLLITINRNGSFYVNSSWIDKSKYCANGNGTINVGRLKSHKCSSCHQMVERTHWAHLKDNSPILVAELCMACHRMYDACTGQDIKI